MSELNYIFISQATKKQYYKDKKHYNTIQDDVPA